MRQAVKPPVNCCACPVCRRSGEHPEKALHRRINLLLSVMNARQRRWFAALEAERLGRGGIARMALISGLDRKTIRRGIQELEDSLD